MPSTKPTRVATDLLNAAAAEGAVQSRSAVQQLDHWARMGRSVAVHGAAGRARLVSALAGTTPLHHLSAAEQERFNLELDADISARAAAVSFGPDLANAGITTVSLDDDGNLVRHHPNGTTSTITADTLA